MPKKFLLSLLLLVIPQLSFGTADPTLVGAQHAFDHLGNIGEQAATASASGSTILYVSGIGALGYGGLPATAEFQETKSKTRAYFSDARRRGINGIIGYVCATSSSNFATSIKTGPKICGQV